MTGPGFHPCVPGFELGLSRSMGGITKVVCSFVRHSPISVAKFTPHLPPPFHPPISVAKHHYTVDFEKPTEMGGVEGGVRDSEKMISPFKRTAVPA